MSLLGTAASFQDPNHIYRTRAAAGLGSACGLGASPTPDLVLSTSGWREEALHAGIDGGDLAARPLCCAGKLLTGNIGSLCEQQPLKALRAPCGPIPQYKILYYFPPPPPCAPRLAIPAPWRIAISHLPDTPRGICVT
jgi:hypothetical protein